MTQPMAYVYVLRDPETLDVRYVGKACDAKKRLASHLRDSTRRQTPVALWIRSIGVPVMEVVEGPIADWPEAERRIIAKMRQDGCDLLNAAPGGSQPFCPLAVRQANGRSNAMLRVSTPKKKRMYQIRRDLGDMLKRGYVSEKTKKRMGEMARRHPGVFPAWANL